MPTLLINGIVLVVSILVVLGFLLVLRYRWTPTKLREANDATVFYMTVTGSIYAVMLAFMLSSVWEDFQDAKVNCEQEANALVNIFRLSEGLTDARREEIQGLAREYAQEVLNEEWSALERQELSPRGSATVERIWHAIMQVNLSTPSEQVSFHHMQAGLIKMIEHRRIRLIQSKLVLPDILWVVLIFGGIITVGNSCLLGVENPLLHMLYIVSLTCIVMLMLIAIADINHPFQGGVRVKFESFELALETFEQLSAS